MEVEEEVGQFLRWVLEANVGGEERKFLAASIVDIHTQKYTCTYIYYAYIIMPVFCFKSEGQLSVVV